MMAAELQHQDRPTDESWPVRCTTSAQTAKKCRHYFCTDCMRGYIRQQLQVRVLFGVAGLLLVMLAVCSSKLSCEIQFEVMVCQPTLPYRIHSVGQSLIMKQLDEPT
jgi:hypothetical protein